MSAWRNEASIPDGSPAFIAAFLPGPDTASKLAAIKESDARFQHMLVEAGRTGWPEAFTEDLYLHDLQALKENPGQSMLWVLRQNGTHLYPLTCENSHEAAYCRQVVRYWSATTSSTRLQPRTNERSTTS